MHNNFIQIAVDTGLLGLSTWVGIWFYFFLLLYQRAKALNGDTDERWVVLGSAAGAIAFLTGGLFETNFYDSEVAMTLYFLMALPFSGMQNGIREHVSLPGYQGKQRYVS
jgi:O-antigen ligase